MITADYIGWFNQQRLMHRLGRDPPAEAEAAYYDRTVANQPAGSQNPEGAWNPGWFSERSPGAMSTQCSRAAIAFIGPRRAAMRQYFAAT